MAKRDTHAHRRNTRVSVAVCVCGRRSTVAVDEYRSARETQSSQSAVYCGTEKDEQKKREKEER